jgi:hypothetical protein
LKHIRAAALAAALLPLASVAAAPVQAQDPCASGGCSVSSVSGVVWSDTNPNGVQDAGEPGIEGAKVFVCVVCTGTDTIETETGPDGTFSVPIEGGTATVAVLVPTETKASPSNVPGDESKDSDGVPDGGGFSVATQSAPGATTDFGFVPSPDQPGTGTPGYWKNHPEAWPVDSITIGGRSYTRDEAIAWLKKVGKDKTTTMFSSLVPAKLNVMIGNGGCVNGTIAAADAWMATNPVGSGVAASSPAWIVGEPLHQTLDSYNNGRLCAPHRVIGPSYPFWLPADAR